MTNSNACYLDHAGSAPLRASAREAISRAWELSGNASAVHSPGRAARRSLEDSRDLVAEALGAHPSEVIFTSGATEADNLAILGLVAADGAAPVPFVTSPIEHQAVLGPARHLAAAGRVRLREVDIAADGRVTPAALLAALRDVREGAGGGPAGGAPYAVVSIGWANSEIGTVQDMAALADAARAEAGVVFHSDAVPAVGSVSIDFAAIGLDALSVSSHKLGGPAGVGALLLRRETKLAPVYFGGGQERALRPGSYDVAGAAGFAAALSEAVAERGRESTRIGALRNELAAALLAVPGVHLTGPAVDEELPGRTSSTNGGVAGPARLASNVHVTVDGARSELLLFALDAAGVAASAGSACHAGVTELSHVLLALGMAPERANGALRFTLGHTTSAADIQRVAACWPSVVSGARAASEASRSSAADRASAPRAAAPANPRAAAPAKSGAGR